MGRRVKIELHVEASRLFQMTNPSQQDIHDRCFLSDDNNGFTDSGKIEDFISNVYLSKEIEWVGLTDDKWYSIAIDSIVYDLNLNNNNAEMCFGNDESDDFVVKGKGGISGNVVATVKDRQSLVGLENIYKINFTVYYKEESKSYMIDPKIAINP